MSLLKIKELGINFGGLRAVNNFDIQLEQGEIVGLIGPNGAGKTTVFNMISGYYPPTDGTINYDGHSILGYKPYQVAQAGISRTFQNIRLFQSNTVLDNVRVAFHPRTGYGLIDAFLRTPRFKRHEQELTNKAFDILETMNIADKALTPVQGLPYGAQRRVEIARALAVGPKLLLLDEPAAGMNPVEVEEMVELIRFIKEKFNLTVLLIEHQMGLVMNICQRLVVLDFGQIIASGLPEEIRKDQKVLEAYLGRGAVA